MFDPKGRAKWDAWEAKKGMSTEDAEQAYADLLESLLAWSREKLGQNLWNSVQIKKRQNFRR